METGLVRVIEATADERVRVFRKAPSTTRCPAFVRREVAEALPGICEVLLNRVKDEGDVAALKVLWQMAGLDKVESGPGAREMGFARKALKAFRASREAGVV